MRGLALMFVVLAAPVGVARAQERGRAAAPRLTLTLSVEKAVWRAGEPAPVRVRIKNDSGVAARIPSAISFRADNRRRDGATVTMAHGFFTSPVSLSKSYAAGAARCQDDLSPDRVETVRGTNIRVVRPPRESLTLGAGESREFAFDLAATCWGHVIQSSYPSSYIFALAPRYGRSYRLYFEMQFPNGGTRVGGTDVPTFEHLRSNEVEININ